MKRISQWPVRPPAARGEGIGSRGSRLRSAHRGLTITGVKSMSNSSIGSPASSLVRLAAGQRIELRLLLGAVVGGRARRPSCAASTKSATMSLARMQSAMTVFGELDAAVADMVEQRLIGMGEADQRGEAEGPAAALDRVDGAEHRIEPVGVAVALLDGGELLLELEQQLGALVEIGGLEVVEVAH